eukprot:scaffold61087_cov75-Phaeocystis_antarctica.AAC.1
MAPWGARKRRRSGWANDTRLAPPAYSTAPERPRMDTGHAQRQPCGPHRILQEEVRWRPQKHDSRVPATLVPDGVAPRTQQSHPSTLGGLGTHNERFNSRVPLDATPLGGHHPTSGPSTATTRAPRVLGVTGWLSAPRRASPNVGACTGSICVRVALRRGGPCGAPEPPGALGASARARCARRAGAGGARGVRLPPAPMRIPRRARGTCVGRSLHPCALHTVRRWVGRVRGDDTVRGSRLRPEDLTTITAHAWGLAYLPPHHQLAASPGCSSSWTRTRCCGPTRAAGGSVTVTVRSLGPHMARERTSKASTGRACLPHCVAHTAAHIAPHEWAKVHTGTRDRGCVTAACGCRDIELSAACTCPCRRSSTARCMAGQPPLLKDSRVRGMCARGRTSNWLSVPEHTRLKRAAGRVRSGAGHGRDSRLESVATRPPLTLA